MLSTRPIPEPVERASAFLRVLNDWRSRVGVPPLSEPQKLKIMTFLESNRFEIYPPATDAAIENWEKDHGFLLPESFKHWLRLSNGLSINGTRWIHGLRSIGPTVRFFASDRLLLQPISWYEFGNPNDWPVNFDLISLKLNPTNIEPVFLTCEDCLHDQLRIIAFGFKDWFLKLMDSAFDPDVTSVFSGTLGDPVREHYRHVTPPKLRPEHCRNCNKIGELLVEGQDERQIMQQFGLTRHDLEQVINAFQYRREKMAYKT